MAYIESLLSGGTSLLAAYQRSIAERASASSTIYPSVLNEKLEEDEQVLVSEVSPKETLQEKYGVEERLKYLSQVESRFHEAVLSKLNSPGEASPEEAEVLADKLAQAASNIRAKQGPTEAYRFMSDFIKSSDDNAFSLTESARQFLAGQESPASSDNKTKLGPNSSQEDEPSQDQNYDLQINGQALSAANKIYGGSSKQRATLYDGHGQAVSKAFALQAGNLLSFKI
jgi:hypothetical protein